MNARTPRTEDTREATLQEETWTPAASLPDPEPEDGFGFRWIRKATLGEVDMINMAKSRREGWMPVSCQDQPTLAQHSDSNDYIEVGGLILCKLPRAKLEARRKYFEARAREQVDGVGRDLAREAGADPRMPIFQERTTKLSREP